MTGVEDFFASVAARHPRCFWLDGGGARAWSGRRSVVGWLDASDLSLTYSAATREVTRWADGRGEVVGDDVFAVLGSEVDGGRGQWFGYLGYAARPDLPATPDALMPDAVWMRPSHVRQVDHAVSPTGGRGGGGGAGPTRPRPPATRRRTPGCRSTCTPATATRST